ncbi:MAG TPA: TadE/TadG family type IV pilus assembly protein [Anaerolineae bacterium]|nr:TadE/TadG family type IV pilus assembly protein [Anaerolineae bacterium]
MGKTSRSLQKSVGRRRPTDGERGQSLVELALMLPFLILLLAVVIDAGRLFDAAIVLVQAAREGARFATIEPSPSVSQIQDLVVQDVVGSGTNITHMADFEASNVAVILGSTAVTVTVSYDFDLWFGGIVGLRTLNVAKQSVMPMYYQEP